MQDQAKTKAAFTETFADNRNGWSVGKSTNGVVTQQITDHAYVIEIADNDWHNWGGPSIFFPNAIDAAIDVTAPGAHTGGGWGVGLGVRATSDGNNSTFYLFEISGTGEWLLRARTAAKNFTTLKTGQLDFSIIPDQPITLGLSAVNNRLSCAVNETRIYSMETTLLADVSAPKTIILWAYTDPQTDHLRAEFRNLRVSPQPIIRPIVPPATLTPERIKRPSALWRPEILFVGIILLLGLVGVLLASAVKPLIDQLQIGQAQQAARQQYGQVAIQLCQPVKSAQIKDIDGTLPGDAKLVAINGVDQVISTDYDRFIPPDKHASNAQDVTHVLCTLRTETTLNTFRYTSNGLFDSGHTCSEIRTDLSAFIVEIKSATIVRAQYFNGAQPDPCPAESSLIIDKRGDPPPIQTVLAWTLQ